VSTSAIPGVIDYLVATFTSAATLGAANPPVTIVDGAFLSNDHPPLSLVVGSNDVDGAFLPEAATATQEWVGPGNRKRNERLSILCIAEAWSGDESLSAVRVAAAAILSAVEDLTRADANLGGTVLYTSPGVNNVLYRYGQTNLGPLCRVFFSIDAFARIGV